MDYCMVNRQPAFELPSKHHRLRLPSFPAAPTTSRDPELNSSSIHRSTVPSFSYLLRHASVLRLLMDGAGSEESLLEALCSTP